MVNLARIVRRVFWPLYFVSLLFPILAGLKVIGAENPVIGYIDVFIAFLLFLCLIVIERNFKMVKPDAVRRYKTVSVVFLLAIVGYFIFQDRLLWDVLLIGLGWRLWLLFQVLPHDFQKQEA